MPELHFSNIVVLDTDQTAPLGTPPEEWVTYFEVLVEGQADDDDFRGVVFFYSNGDGPFWDSFACGPQRALRYLEIMAAVEGHGEVAAALWRDLHET